MPGPLEGLRVIDVGALIAGPWAATTLADQGADVIKVERPGVGDLFRHVGSNRGGMSGMFHVLNRGKRSLAVDLANPKGVEVFLALAATADVIVQNLRPGVVDRIGIGYEQVKEQREDIVYLSLSGFGSKGPYAHKRVYDNVIQTYSGLADAQMNPTTGEPEFLRQLLTDKLTAWAGAQAVTAALLGRALGRGGQHIEMSMLDTAVAFMWPDRAGDRILLGEGINEQPPLGPNFQLLPLADGFGTVTAFADSEFTGLCKALGLHEIAADPRFANTAARMENLDLVTRAYRDAIGPAASKLTREEFERRLDAEDVPHGVVRRLDELHADPQVIANEIFQERDHHTAGRLREPRHPARFSGTPLGRPSDAPGLGEHTDEILGELDLGARASDLRSEGVIG